MTKIKLYSYLIAMTACLVLVPAFALGAVNPVPTGANVPQAVGASGNGVLLDKNAKPASASSSIYAAVDNIKINPPDLKMPDYSAKQYPAEPATTDDYVENEVCGQLFTSDPSNIFRTVFCSLIRITAISTADFATNITCSIQAVGMRGNYFQDLVFGKATPTATPPNACVVGTEKATAVPARTGAFGARTSSSSTTPASGGDGFYNSATSSLSDNIINPDPAVTSTTQGAFNWTKNIVSIIAFIALLIFAFANILHIDLNTYAIKKALPALVIAIVGAWLAIYLIFVLSRSADFLYRVTMFSPYQALHPMQNIFGGILNVPDPKAITSGSLDNMNVLNQSARLLYGIGGLFLGGNGTAPVLTFVSGLFGTIMLLVPAIVVFAFEYVMALRPYAVQLLTILSPIAFGCLVLPQTQKFFRLWWSFLLIAIFYAPFSNFIFFILNQIAGPATGNALGVYGTTAQPASGIAIVAIIFFKTAVLFFLVRLPFAFEHDLGKITAKLAGSSLGASLGLPRGSAQDNKQGQKQASPTVADRILATQEAKSLIASTAPNTRVNLKNTFMAKKADALRADPNIIRSIMPQLPKLLDNANQTNMARTAPLLVKSTADLSPEAFRAIIGQSDLKLWRNSGLISELKNQGGQILDNQGAAIRADSARKLVRLAQVMEAGKVSNPDALKLLAEKGALSNVPLPVIKSAIDNKILGMADLFPTYKNQSQSVFEKVQSLSQSNGAMTRSTNASTVKTLMEQDRKDFETGFKDMTKMFTDIVHDSKVIPPPPSDSIRKIVTEMKNTDSNIFDKNGPYVMKRLGDVSQNATKSISSIMQSEGVSPQTAIAIAHNPRIDFEDAKKYMPPGSKPESIAFMREGFINRDLSSDLTKEVSESMVQQKTMIGQTISQKISDNLKKDPAGSLEKVKVGIDDATKKLSAPATVSAADFKKAVSQIEQFYPGSVLKTNGEMNPEDVAEVSGRAKSVSEVIEALQNNGIDEKTLTSNPAQASNAIASQMKQDVAKTLAENTSAGAQFKQQLDNTVAKAPKIDLKGA